MEDIANHSESLISLLPLLLMSVIFGVVAHMLAKDKGRNVGLWTILGVVPIVNIFCMWFFVGAANLRLEGKIDQLLGSSGKNEVVK